MLKNKRVLVTCGPTWVPIDAMRVISNRSSGKLGQMIAKDFSEAGARVTLLEGPVECPLRSKSVRVIKFSFFDELAALMKKELKRKYDICIHAAAVSDYQVKKPKRAKLDSGHKNLRLELVPTEKLVHIIKKFNPGLFLVAFKLETKITELIAIKKSRSLFREGRSSLVVANSFKGKTYSGYILDTHHQILTHKRSRRGLSKILVKIVKEHL
ncbi:MAG: hypothetical protein JW847_05855 [Candidatus Omnitrophica bacterium]|nr:hypothetical protein [Candidatus Omnitrophota bacterium]